MIAGLPVCHPPTKSSPSRPTTVLSDLIMSRIKSREEEKGGPTRAPRDSQVTHIKSASTFFENTVPFCYRSIQQIISISNSMPPPLLLMFIVLTIMWRELWIDVNLHAYSTFTLLQMTVFSHFVAFTCRDKWKHVKKIHKKNTQKKPHMAWCGKPSNAITQVDLNTQKERATRETSSLN